MGTGHSLAPKNTRLTVEGTQAYEAKLREWLDTKTLPPKLACYLIDDILPATLTCDCANPHTCHAKVLMRVARYFKEIEDMVGYMNLQDCVWYRLSKDNVN